MTKGLYFYKLNSPYPEDITKDCKLTINEIDSNFINLKDVDIKDVRVDEDKKELVMTRNNGEELIFNIAEMVHHEDPTFDVEYDSVEGEIDIEYNGEKYAIKGLITKDNHAKELLVQIRQVYSDSSLKGTGLAKDPLRVSEVYKTGYYKPVLKLIDTTVHEKIPVKHLEKGDRYVVLEEVQNFGQLYNFNGVKHINKLLQNSGWRIPTKEDWDDMLNAIEPCEYRNHNSLICNRVFGKMAGSLLKSEEEWRTFHCDGKPHHPHHENTDHHHIHNEAQEAIEDEFEYPFDEYKEDGCPKPKEKCVSPLGLDAYGMGILPSGYAYYSRPMQYQQFGYQGAYWTDTQMEDTSVYTKVFEANESGVSQIGERPTAFISIRLIKDYDGTNHRGIEDILGTNYQTVLLPSLRGKNGFAVWTAQNLDLREKHIESYLPNAGLGIEKRKTYFIYEWNGFDWDKIEMSEGESVTILRGKKDNESYRIINGVLTNITEHIIETVTETIDDHLNEIDGKLQSLEEGLFTESDERQKADKELEDKINHEASERQEADEKLGQKIETVEEERKKVESDLWEAINNETVAREKVESDIWSAINQEAAAREDVDNQQWAAITAETAAREDVESQIWSAVNGEIAAREDVEKQIWEAIGKESAAREDVDNQQWNAINGEIAAREKVESDIWSAINDEISRAKESESKLDERVTDLEERVIKKDECEYDEKSGILTLPTENLENTIKVKFSFDFGEC